ncbi:MAG: recombinase family protein [Gluconacetobacter sp.]
MIYGYARVSTGDQSADMQVRALIDAGILETCIYQDVFTGTSKDRPEFSRLLEQVQTGDTIICWKLDRLGRSVSHLSALLEDMDRKGVTIRSLVDGLDTSNKSSKMLYHMLSIVSEMERDNIHARVLEGISNAQKFGTKSGKPIGRPKVDRLKIEQAIDLMHQGKSIRIASRRTGIGEATLYRRLAEFRKPTEFKREQGI